MKNLNDLPNRGENILSISGSARGITLLLIGDKTNLIEILRMAAQKSQPLREILAGLKDGEFEGNQ
jgi:hypothetical protein